MTRSPRLATGLDHGNRSAVEQSDIEPKDIQVKLITVPGVMPETNHQKSDSSYTILREIDQVEKLNLARSTLDSNKFMQD